jgi:hypothetical protein
LVAVGALLVISGHGLALETSRYPLLVIEQNRASIVKAVVDKWWPTFASLSGTERKTPEQLGDALWKMRADRLLAASLAGTGVTVQDMVADSERDIGNAHTNKPNFSTKALGDTIDDLVYTPITPCRIVDTRNAIGALAANTARGYDGYTTSTFVAQGGATSNCGIPNNVAAIAVTATAVQPTASGFINLYAGNTFAPNASTLSFAAGQFATATGAIVPVDATTNNRFTALSPVTVDLVIDAVGYFKRPGDATGLDIVVNAQRTMRYQYNASAPNIIGGGATNTLGSSSVYGVTIAGGGSATLHNCGDNGLSDCANIVSANFGTIGGGANNHAAGTGFSTVAGGNSNRASGYASTVGGGLVNMADAFLSSVGGGYDNKALGSHSSVGGGSTNSASGDYAAIVGGINNVSLAYGSIGGGQGNAAYGYGAVSGGGGNKAFGAFSAIGGGVENIAAGDYAVIPGGNLNYAPGAYSFAAGRNARTSSAPGINHDGAFVWSDSNNFAFTSTANNEFAVRSTGGVRLVLGIDGSGNPTWTCAASNGNGWACSSDRDLKENFAPVDTSAVLNQIARLPLYFWNAKGGDPRVRHIGPTAQDFIRVFEVGNSDKMIGMQDADGVALAAVQRLHQLVRERDAEISALNARLQAIEKKLGLEKANP